MSTERKVQKNLAGEEDLLLGEGTVQQSRNNLKYTISKLSTIRPVNSTVELNALDPDRFKKAALFDTNADLVTLYNYNSGTGQWDEILVKAPEQVIPDVPTALVVDVKDHGATGDGSTDDTTAVLAADAEAKSLGYALYFPNGSYKILQSLNLTSGQTIYGESRSVKLQFWAADGVVVDTVQVDITVSNLTLESFDAGGVANPKTFNGIDLENATNVRVGNVQLTGWGRAVSMTTSQYLYFTQIHFNTCGNGYRILTTVSNLYLTRCTGSVDLLILQLGTLASVIRITDCIYTGGQYGLFASATSTYSDILVMSSSFTGMVIAGMSITDGSGFKAVGSTFKGDSGVHLNKTSVATEDLHFLGCTIEATGVANSAFATGVGCASVTITGGLIASDTGRAIEIENSNLDVAITGVALKSNASFPIYLKGTAKDSTRVTGCTGDNEVELESSAVGNTHTRIIGRIVYNGIAGTITANDNLLMTKNSTGSYNLTFTYNPYNMDNIIIETPSNCNVFVLGLGSVLIETHDGSQVLQDRSSIGIVVHEIF